MLYFRQLYRRPPLLLEVVADIALPPGGRYRGRQNPPQVRPEIEAFPISDEVSFLGIWSMKTDAVGL